MLICNRETIKRVLALPPDTRIEWKSHDESIAQRNTLDQQRQEKAQERRRVGVPSEEAQKENPKAST